MFKAIEESKYVGAGVEQSIAVEKALSSSWIEPSGTSFAGKGSISIKGFQESLREIYKSQGANC